jgi:hypothetical protein
MVLATSMRQLSVSTIRLLDKLLSLQPSILATIAVVAQGGMIISVASS